MACALLVDCLIAGPSTGVKRWPSVSNNRFACVRVGLALCLMWSTAAASPWTKFRDAVTSPVRVPAKAIETFVEKPTLKNAVDVVTSPIEAVDQTLKNTVEGVNELVDQSPTVKEAIKDKQIVVTVPTGDDGTSAPSSGAGRAPTTGDSGSGAGNGSPAPVVSVEVGAEVQSNDPTVVVLPTPGHERKPAGEHAPDRRVYGPSEISEQNSAPEGGAPWVPIDHTNKEEYFAIEKVVNDTAKELGVQTPKISGAYRDPSVGKLPSKRHAFAALDLATTDEKFALALSKKLGPGYFVQIEFVNVPEAGKQSNVRFYDGKNLGVEKLDKIKASNNHTHAHLCPDPGC